MSPYSVNLKIRYVLFTIGGKKPLKKELFCGFPYFVNFGSKIYPVDEYSTALIECVKRGPANFGKPQKSDFFSGFPYPLKMHD